MGEWGALEKVLTGSGVALALVVFGFWKLWARYTFTADREDARRDAQNERILRALDSNTAALVALKETVEAGRQIRGP